MWTLPMPIFNPSPSISSHSPTTRQVSLVLTIISDTSTLSDLAIHSISQELVWVGENLGIEFTISNVQRFGKWRRKTYTMFTPRVGYIERCIILLLASLCQLYVGTLNPILSTCCPSRWLSCKLHFPQHNFPDATVVRGFHWHSGRDYVSM